MFTNSKNFIKIPFVLFLFLFGCFNVKYPEEYEKDLRKYMKKQFGITRLEGNYYFFLINDCEQCLGPVLNLRHLNEHSYKNLTLIIIGNSTIREINQNIEKIHDKYPVLTDPGQNIFRHSTGFSKSLLIKTRNNRIIFVKNINDTEIQKFDLYLQE